MISYSDKIIISEIINLNGDLALVSNNTFFKPSLSKSVSDIGRIGKFNIIDVKEQGSFFIHKTSKPYEEFSKDCNINSYEELVSSTQDSFVLSTARKAILKKEKLIDFIQNKLTFNLIDYYIGRFGLLLIFETLDYTADKFLSFLYKKIQDKECDDLLPFFIKAFYTLQEKTFVWSFFPEDLCLIIDDTIFADFLSNYDTTLLFKPIFERSSGISTVKYDFINYNFIQNDLLKNYFTKSDLFSKQSFSDRKSGYFIIDKDNYSFIGLNKDCRIFTKTASKDGFKDLYNEYVEFTSLN
jgi:hypothetical protein